MSITVTIDAETLSELKRQMLEFVGESPLTRSHNPSPPLILAPNPGPEKAAIGPGPLPELEPEPALERDQGFESEPEPEPEAAPEEKKNVKAVVLEKKRKATSANTTTSNHPPSKAVAELKSGPALAAKVKGKLEAVGARSVAPEHPFPDVDGAPVPEKSPAVGPHPADIDDGGGDPGVGPGEVMAALSAVSTHGPLKGKGLEVARDLLRKYGADRFSALKPESFAAFVQDANAILGRV